MSPCIRTVFLFYNLLVIVMSDDKLQGGFFIMRKREMTKLMAAEAHKRMKSAQSLVVIGPTSSGKSTLVYALVNHKLIKFIMVGVGDKCQTTIIPCNFMFDARIERNEDFSIQIKSKSFSTKPIHMKVMEMLAKQFAANDYDCADTIDSIDEAAFQMVLEPTDASYHLGKLADEISIEQFKLVINTALLTIENAEEPFLNRVKAKKKEPDKRKVSIEEIRNIVMEDMWSELNPILLEEYQAWLNSIGKLISDRLDKCLGCIDDPNSILEYTVDENDAELKYGGAILQSLFDPFEPYSLVIEDMTVACRPREELIKQFDDKIPLRFCLRDTMGLNQISADNNSIKDALDIALNCSPDSILLLMNLEEKDEVIIDCCEAINTRVSKAQKLDIPIYVIFTKADRVISNIINKAERDTVELRQEDYSKNICGAIDTMEKSIKKYLTCLKNQDSTWLSIRYMEEKIDPIQTALRDLNDERRRKFTQDGLYEFINEVLMETQMRILPKGMKAPLFVTVKETSSPAINISVIQGAISTEYSQIVSALTTEKAIVNGYQITDTRRIHGRSVVRYYENLQVGLGYTTNAYVYGNFSINMKGMLRKVLEKYIPDFLTLYESEAIKTLADNLDDVELDYIIEELDANKDITRFAFSDINPAVFDGIPEKAKKIQKLHLIFRHYFAASEKYNMVLDKVAFNLSYGNKIIRNMVDQKYNEPYITYDQTIRDMQENFIKFFSSERFADMLTTEISNAMTEIVNKMFVII